MADLAKWGRGKVLQQRLDVLLLQKARLAQLLKDLLLVVTLFKPESLDFPLQLEGKIEDLMLLWLKEVILGLPIRIGKFWITGTMTELTVLIARELGQWLLEQVVVIAVDVVGAPFAWRMHLFNIYCEWTPIARWWSLDDFHDGAVVILWGHLCTLAVLKLLDFTILWAHDTLLWPWDSPRIHCTWVLLLLSNDIENGKANLFRISFNL